MSTVMAPPVSGGGGAAFARLRALRSLLPREPAGPRTSRGSRYPRAPSHANRHGGGGSTIVAHSPAVRGRRLRHRPARHQPFAAASPRAQIACAGEVHRTRGWRRTTRNWPSQALRRRWISAFSAARLHHLRDRLERRTLARQIVTGAHRRRTQLPGVLPSTAPARGRSWTRSHCPSFRSSRRPRSGFSTRTGGGRTC